MLFKLSNLISNLALTLGYLNPALNNSALIRCQTGLNAGGKTCIISFSTRFAAIFRNKLHVFVVRITVA